MYVAGPGQQAGVFGVFALVVDLCGDGRARPSFSLGI